MRASLARFAVWLHRCGWLALVAGLLLHFTIRDRIDYVATVFYALPLPLLGCLAVVLCAWPRWRRGAAVVALLVFVIWFSRSWCWNDPKPAVAGTPEFRALYWNLSRPMTPCVDLIDLVSRLQPDVVGCVEPGDDFMRHSAAYEKALPGYTCHLMPRGIMLLSRWPVKMLGRGRLDATGAFAYFDVTAPQGAVRLVLVDVWAAPLLPRKRSLDESLSYAENRGDCIIMGDFNTPAESAWFGPYRAQTQSAFAVGGRGFRETWFWRLPVLSLDHIWVGKNWRVIETQKINRWSSDHAALFVRLQ